LLHALLNLQWARQPLNIRRSGNSAVIFRWPSAAEGGGVMHRYRVLLVLVLVVAMAWPPVGAEAQTAGPAEQAIRQVLEDQAAAWNRGDVDAFMQGYANSPQTAFVGKTVEYGYDLILNRYKKAYPSPAAMGKLSFANLAIRMLGSDYAVVTGNFHLQRTPAGGGDAGGIFSLVLAKTDAGWKVILDHTVAD
jgi:uncharacterized protein (TIGR02246 family)